MEAHTLRGLRLSRKVTQTQLARRPGRARSAVSIMESSEDHLMSTVRSVVEGLGGSIEMVAVFAERKCSAGGTCPATPLVRGRLILRTNWRAP